MRLRGKKASRPRVSYALWTTMILVVSVGLWRIIQLYGQTTLDCREYFNWMHDGHQYGTSLLWASIGLSLALCAYLIADIVRVKPHRTAITIRLFQALLCGLTLSASVIQWGIFIPDSRLAEPARRLEYTLGHFPLFDTGEVALFEYSEADGSARPVPLNRHYSQSSPFAMKAGRLRCEVEAEQEARANWYWRHSIAPNGILEDLDRQD